MKKIVKELNIFIPIFCLIFLFTLSHISIDVFADSNDIIFTDKDGYDYTEDDIFQIQNSDNVSTLADNKKYSGPAKWNISESGSDNLFAYIFKKKNGAGVENDKYVLVIDGDATNAKEYDNFYYEYIANEFSVCAFRNNPYAKVTSPNYDKVIPWTIYVDPKKITDAGITSSVNCDNYDGWFGNLSNLTNLKIDLNGSTKKTPNSMIATFFGTNITASNLEDVFDKIDTSSVTSMKELFAIFKGSSIPLDKISTDNLVDGSYMFSYSNISTIDWDSINWNLEKCTNLNHMFCYANSLTEVDLTGFKNTKSVTTIEGMFCNCENLTSINFGDNFETDSITSIKNLFSNSKKLSTIDFGDKFDLKNPVNMEGAFQETTLPKYNLNDMGSDITPSSIYCLFSNISPVANGILDLSTLNLKDLNETETTIWFNGNVSGRIQKIILPKNVPAGFDLKLASGNDYWIKNSNDQIVTTLGTDGKVTKLYAKGGSDNLSYIYVKSFEELRVEQINNATSDEDIYNKLTVYTKPANYSGNTRQVIDWLDEDGTVYNKWKRNTTNKGQKIAANYVWNRLKALKEANGVGYLSASSLIADIGYAISYDYGEKILINGEVVEEIYVDYKEKANFSIGDSECNTDKMYLAFDLEYDNELNKYSTYHEILSGNVETPMTIKKDDWMYLFTTFKDSVLLADEKIESWEVEILININADAIIEMINDAVTDADINDLFYYHFDEFKTIVDPDNETNFDYNNDTYSKCLLIINYLWNRKEITPYTSIEEIKNDIILASSFTPVLYINKQSGNAYVYENDEAFFSIENNDELKKVADIFNVQYLTKDKEAIDGFNTTNNMLIATQSNAGEFIAILTYKNSELKDYSYWNNDNTFTTEVTKLLIDDRPVWTYDGIEYYVTDIVNYDHDNNDETNEIKAKWCIADSDALTTDLYAIVLKEKTQDDLYTGDYLLVFTGSEREIFKFETCLDSNDNFLNLEIDINHPDWTIDTWKTNKFTPWLRLPGDVITNIKKAIVSKECNPKTYNYLFCLSQNSNLEEVIFETNGGDKKTPEGFKYAFCYAKITDFKPGNIINAANVTDISHMFECCSELKEVDLTGLNVKPINMDYLFNDCEKLDTINNINNINTERTLSLESVFENTSIEELNLKSWNISNITNLNNLFKDCNSLKKLDLSGWTFKEGLINYDISLSSLKYIVLPNNIPGEIELPGTFNFYHLDGNKLYELKDLNDNTTSDDLIPKTLTGYKTKTYNVAKALNVLADSTFVTPSTEPNPNGGGGGGGASGGGGGGSPTPEIKEIELHDVIMHTAFINGYDDGTFKPNNPITRAEFAKIMASINKDFKVDDYKTATNIIKSYEDIRDEFWYTPYIAFVIDKKIMIGYPEGDFKPDGFITRAEVSKVLGDVYDIKDLGIDNPFTSEMQDWFKDQSDELIRGGIIKGYDDGTFGPSRNITRAEFVALINRVNENTPDREISKEMKDELNIKFSDVKEKDWFYLDILEASINHKGADFHKAIFDEEESKKATKKK